MIKISASILNCDFSKLGEEISRLEAAGVDMLHLDIMDGLFVPNISFGPSIVSAVRMCTNLPLDVHLMIDRPERYVEDFAAAGADILTVHVEASIHLNRTIQMIKSLGMKAGVSLNPSTPLATVEWVLADVDQILQMTVNPGFGGQQFIESMTSKILTLKEMTIISSRDIDIEVDGGINTQTISKVVGAGANVIVCGAVLFNSDDMNKTVKALRKASE